MTETEYRKLLIDSVCAGEYPEKDDLLECLKITSLRFEKRMCLRDIYAYYEIGRMKVLFKLIALFEAYVN